MIWSTLERVVANLPLGKIAEGFDKSNCVQIQICYTTQYGILRTVDE